MPWLLLQHIELTPEEDAILDEFWAEDASGVATRAMLVPSRP
jgi:hypothetical protein